MNWEVTTYSPWDYPEIPKGTPLISATFCGGGGSDQKHSETYYKFSEFLDSHKAIFFNPDGKKITLENTVN